MQIEETLFNLGNIYSPVSDENSISEYITELLKGYMDEISTDCFGNVTAIRRCGLKNAPRMLLDAHMDEVGMMITDITDEGYLRFEAIGVDPGIAPAREVLVMGKEAVFGVVSTIPVKDHVDGQICAEITDMVIDVGYRKEQVEQLIKIGDMAVFRSEACHLCGNMVMGKAFDDRAGITVILYVLEQLKNTVLPVDLIISATVQEEAGCRGIVRAAYNIHPDYAIVIDTAHAKTPDAPAHILLESGKGPVILMGPNMDKGMTQRLIGSLMRLNMEWQPEVCENRTGSNARTLQTVGNGVRVGFVAIALKYMHTSYEVICTEDIKNAGLLIADVIKNFRRDGYCADE